MIKGSPVHVAPACTGSGEGSDHEMEMMCREISSEFSFFIAKDLVCCALITRVPNSKTYFM
jgi:hypothetical protein